MIEYAKFPNSCLVLAVSCYFYQYYGDNPCNFQDSLRIDIRLFHINLQFRAHRDALQFFFFPCNLGLCSIITNRLSEVKLQENFVTKPQATR
jgi:hypothetical protein